MRNLGLDILRLVAVVLVLGRHFELPKSECSFLKIWQTGGWVGVDLFFVLSGFLVSGLLFKEFKRKHSINLKSFLIRRALKIYPAFYVMIFFTVAVKVLSNETFKRKHLLGELLFTQNYVGGLWNHTWSLAVEEHFYIALAALCYFIIKPIGNRREQTDAFKVIPTAFFITALSCLSLRVLNLYQFDVFSYKWFLFVTHIRIDSLMFGVLLSYGWHFRNLELKIAKISTCLLVAIGCLALSPAFVFPLEKYRLISVFGVILFYIGSGCLVLSAVRLQTAKLHSLTFLGSLGATSYSIYLWHMPLATWGWSWLKKYSGLESYGSYLTFYLLGSLGFGWTMSKVIESPFLKLRDRIFPSTTNRN